MSTVSDLPVLVRSVGPEPTAGYYTQWTTFIAGYPKFKNADTGVSSYIADTNGTTLLAYKAHYLYFTGMGSGVSAQIVDRTVFFDVSLIPSSGYYDIPVSDYQPPDTSYGIGGGIHTTQPTRPPTGPAVYDIVVQESVALRDNSQKRVTPWLSPRFMQERQIGATRWANLAGAAGGPTPATVDLSTALSTQLVMQDFGFHLPTDATIDGIEVQIARKVVGGAVEQSSRWVAPANYLGVAGELISSDSGYHYAPRIVVGDTVYVRDAVTSTGGVILSSGRPKSGASAKILRSTDGGSSWSVISSGLPNGYRITSMAAIGSVIVASVFGYTDKLRILRSTDSGLTWSIVNTNITPPDVGDAFPGQIWQVAGNAVDTFVIGVSRGQVIRSSDLGATWSLPAALVSTTQHVDRVVFSGSKFVCFVKSGTPQLLRYMNSTDGVTWVERNSTDESSAPTGGFPTVFGGMVVIPSRGTGKIVYSTDSGDTWSVFDFPATPYGADYASAIYDPVRGRYLFLGQYSDYWGIVVESSDFPPTTTRILADTEGEPFGEWSFYYPPHLGVIYSDRYGVRHEEVQLLVGGTGSFTPADAIYDEGRSITGGTFAYRETFLSIGGAEDDLRNTHPKTYGGAERRGSDPNASSGAQAWLPAEVNVPSFGIGYQAEGTQGVLQVGDVKVRIHYRGDFASETLPGKRSVGLAGVAEAPDGTKIAVGVGGKIMRKPANGSTWSVVTSPSAVDLNSVTWTGDRFVAVGFGGVTLDGGATGASWTRVDSGAVTSLWAIRRVPGTLRAVAVGSDDYAFERDRHGVWRA